nr:hypothetical protein [Tanacetum cinerariifolium]
MSTPVFVDPESSTQADGAQSSRVPVPLPEDPYEAIRQAYLVGMDIESEPLRSMGFGTSDTRSTSSDFTVPLSPDHPLTHTTPVLVPILRRTARMVVCVPLVMSPSLSAGIAEVETMSDSAFRKRFRSSYDSLPSPTLPVRKRYRGTSELILGADSEENEEVEESSDFDSESEDVEDEGPTAEDEDPAAEDEGLAAKVEGPGVDDESYGLDESDGLGLGEEEAVPEGQQQAVLVVGTAVSEPLGLGYGVLRHQELALEEDHVYNPEDGMVYIEVPIYPPLVLPVQTPPSPKWTSGLLHISPSPFVVPSHVSSPMIPLTVPSPIASPMATSATPISVDEDLFIEDRIVLNFTKISQKPGNFDTIMKTKSKAGSGSSFSRINLHEA